MSDKTTEWVPTGLERFGHLEDKIFRVVEAFKAVRKENETLQAENEKLKADLETSRQRESQQGESLAELEKEREELRERVEKALELLTTLEAV